jgi:hypothetical protein
MLGSTPVVATVLETRVRASPLHKRRHCCVEMVEQSDAKLLASWIEWVVELQRRRYEDEKA